MHLFAVRNSSEAGQTEVPDRECGYREKLSDFKKKRENGSAGKRDVQKFLQNQQEEKGPSAMAEQLKKWMEQQGK